MASEDVKKNKNLVCVGSSILKQLIPHFQAAGYVVTDLTQPGWIVSDKNISILIKKLSELRLEPGFSVIFDLVGNCTYRYQQFDGTQSLPFKEGGRYHFAGPVSVCNDDTFRRIIKMLGPVLLSAQDAIKIVIPPLPRYLFGTCCASSSHCTNFNNENYAESNLNRVTKLRGILKKDCARLGMARQWVLDGVGALMGVPVGESYGTNREIISELKPVMAKDGVHFDAMGCKNLAAAVTSAIEKMQIGSISDPNTGVSGPSQTGGRTEKTYFWRGFTSPVGDAAGCAALGQHGSGRQKQKSWADRAHGGRNEAGEHSGGKKSHTGRQYHPYTRGPTGGRY
jgi:hypothetical protein